jgi:hypothetical protein
MKRKQTHFLVAPSSFFGGAPVLIAYQRDFGPPERETPVRRSEPAVAEGTETTTQRIRSALNRAREGVFGAWRFPRLRRRLGRQRVGI